MAKVNENADPLSRQKLYISIDPIEEGDREKDRMDQTGAVFHQG